MAVLMLAHVAAIALGLAMGDMFWRRDGRRHHPARLGCLWGCRLRRPHRGVSFLLVRAGRYRTGVALYLACTAAVPLTVPFLGSVRH